MYCQFYGFREKPFSLLPDPEFLFLGSKHEDALNLLELGILNQSGFCVISGEIGTGKTTLVRELLNRLDKSICTGLITNTHSTYSNLLAWILAAYGLKCEASDYASQHRCFTDFVIDQYARRKHTLLIIDEAQNLSLPALEQLRMLSNINSEKDLVLQIMLIGQSELRIKLQKPELEQFAQRIAIDYHLSALDRDETGEYIRHRLSKSGGTSQLFDEAACDLIFRHSGGIPRLINRICDLSLVYGYSESRTVIDAGLIKAVTARQTLGQPTEPPAHGTDKHVPATGSGLATGSAKTIAAEKTAVASKATTGRATMKPAAQWTAAESAAAALQGKARAAKQVAQKAAASLAAAEKTLAEKITAGKTAREKASRMLIQAKSAVSLATTTQQAAGRAADARNAAREKARVTKAAAIAAAREAAVAGDATRTATSDRHPAAKPDGESASVRHPVPVDNTRPRSRPRRAGMLATLSAISVIVAVSTWLVTRPGDMDMTIDALVGAGQSFINSGSLTEAAALETLSDGTKSQPQP